MKNDMTDAVRLLSQGIEIEEVCKVTSLPVDIVQSLAIEKSLNREVYESCARGMKYSDGLRERIEVSLLRTTGSLLEKIEGDIRSPSDIEETRRLHMQTDMVSKLLSAVSKSPVTAINMIQQSGRPLSSVIIDTKSLKD